MKKEQKNEIGLARYAGIAPLLIRPPDDPRSIQSVCEEICAQGVRYPDGSLRHPHPGTIYKWWRSYEKDGFDALLPKERSDAGQSRALDEDAKARIRYYRTKFPGMRASVIYRQLLDDGTFVYGQCSESTVLRYVNQLEAELNQPEKKDMRRFEKEHINELWHADTCYGPYLKDSDGKHRIYFIGFIDDASRMIVGIDVFFHDNFVNVMRVMKSAVSRHGIPTLLNLDNGKSYKNKQMELLAARIGTTLCFNQPYTPQSKAKIERFWNTLRVQFLATLDINEIHSLDELRGQLHAYIQKYNQSVHSSLSGMSPQDRFFSESSRIKRLSAEAIDRTFLLEVERRVSADSVVVIDNTQYEVDCQYARERICLRYSPDMTEIYVVEAGGDLTPIRLLNKHENARIKRNKVHLSTSEEEPQEERSDDGDH